LAKWAKIFNIVRGLKRGAALSTILLNIVLEKVMKTVRLILLERFSTEQHCT
jgi:hypothetical protein